MLVRIRSYSLLRRKFDALHTKAPGRRFTMLASLLDKSEDFFSDFHFNFAFWCCIVRTVVSGMAMRPSKLSYTI